MLRQFRKSTREFFHKGVIYTLLFAVLVQPLGIQQLLAQHQVKKDFERRQDEYARILRTYIDPILLVAEQQQLISKKLLKNVEGCLSGMRKGGETKPILEDMEIFQQKLGANHLKIKAELMDIRRELLEKGYSDEIINRHNEYENEIEQRYQEFNRLLTAVQRNENNKELLEDSLEEFSKFKKPDTQDNSKTTFRYLPQYESQTMVQEMGSSSSSNGLQLFALSGASDCMYGSWWCGELSDIESVTGLPTSDDLAVDSNEINFDPNDSSDPVVTKAMELGKNPVRIFEYVRNELSYEPYLGSVKGVKRTLEEGAGNDFDLASVLIALLRASGVPSRYAFGVIELTAEEAASWLGVNDAEQIDELFNANNIPRDPEYAGSDVSTITIDHVWVKAYVDEYPYRGLVKEDDYEGLGDGDAWLDLDPSFKQHSFTGDRGIENADGIDIDPDTLLTNSLTDATVEANGIENYVFGIDDDLMEEQLLVMAEPVRNYLAARNLTTETVFRQRQVSEERYGLLPNTDQYKIDKRCVNLREIPDELRYKLQITLRNPDSSESFSVTKSLYEILGKKLTLLYEPADDDSLEILEDPNNINDPNSLEPWLVNLYPDLVLDRDSLLDDLSDDTDLEVGLGQAQTLEMYFIGPEGRSKPIIHEITAGGVHSLVVDSQQITGSDLDDVYSSLNTTSSVFDTNDVLAPDETIGDVLHGIGLSYFHQIDRFNQAIAGSLGIEVTRQPSIVRVGWDLSVTELYPGEDEMPHRVKADKVRIDIGREVYAPVAIDKQDGSFIAEDQFLFTSAITSSVLERNTLMQVFGGEASSVAKVIQKANDANDPNIPIYTITSYEDANTLTDVGQPLYNHPNDVKIAIKNAANDDCEITIPKTAVKIADVNYVGYIVRRISDNASDFVLYDQAQEKFTSAEIKNDSLSVIQLLNECGPESDPNGYDNLEQVVESAASWLKVAEDSTTNAGLSYLPAIIDINRWYETRTELDPVTTVASVLVVTSPITRLTSQSAILNVTAGSGLNGQIRSTNTNWVSADANEFIINADVTRGVTWYTDIYKYGESSSYMTDTNNTPELESIFTFAAPNDGYYEYEITAGSDANEATMVNGTFRVDLTDPNATITEANAPDANGIAAYGALVVTGTAKDNYFDFYEVYINQNDTNTLVYTSDYAVDNGTLCTVNTNDFNDGSATVILKAWDLAGNMSEDSESATISNPDRTPPDVTLAATSDGNSLSAELFVTGTIDVNLTPTDANERLQRIELWWCDQDGENCELITTEVDPNNGAVDVNSTNPWTHQINPYEFENGPGRLTVYSWDMFGNIDSNSIDFYNNSHISNFRVTPTTVTPGNTTLTVTASLQTSASWDLYIREEGIDANKVDWQSSEPNILRVTNVTTEDWNDANHLVYLKVGAQEANIPFTVSLDPPIAQISNIEYEDDEEELQDDLQYGGYDGMQVISEGFFDLEGSAYHPSTSNNVEYKVELYEPNVIRYYSSSWKNTGLRVKIVTPDANTSGWTIGRVESGSLGKLDLSGVENGVYQMLLTVKYAGNEAYGNVGFVLDCPLKIGNIKFTQEDLVVPLAGMPLRVIRTYDSLKKETDGDFGHGWSYSIADMDIKLNETRATRPSFYGGNTSIRTSSSYERNITLTLPDGQRATFVFYLDPTSCPDGYGLTCYQAKYMSPPGVTATLRTLENEIMDPFGNWGSVWGSTGAAAVDWSYDFSGYVLATEDGTQYIIERDSIVGGDGWDIVDYYGTPIYARPYSDPPELSRIITPTGETIDISDGSVTHTDTGGNIKTIQFDRDGGHITAVKGLQWENGEPNDLIYVYDSNDNLSEVHRLVDKDAEEYDITYYYYDDATHNPEDHFVTDINDPRGLKPIQYVYDNDNRLIATIDAKGNRINISHAVVDGQNTETVYDRYGNATQYFYNDRGNVTAVVNSMGYSTSYEYTDSTNPDKATAITDPLGNTTYYEYDSSGRTTRIDDPEGNVITNSYNSRGDLLETTQYALNPDNANELIELSRTTNSYNNDNLLKTTTDAAGNVTQYVYDTSNNNLLKTIQQVYDPNQDAVVDVTTTYTYGDPNFPSSPDSIKDTADFTRYFAYDKSGNQVKSWYDWVDANDSDTYATVYTHTEYDAMGRAIETIREVNDINNVTAYTKTLNETYYNSIGKVDFTINQFEAVTAYNYDELGNLVETRIYNSFEDFNDFYDVNIVTIAETLYDKEGRPIVTVDAHAPDANANGTETVYDVLGRVKETRRWADVNVPIVDINGDPNIGRTNVYDVGANNDPNWQQGSLLTVTKTEYDIASRVWKSWTEDEAGQWHATEYEYDKAGRQTAVIDANSNRTEYEYLGSRRVLMRDARNNETQYEYDSLGRLKKTIFPDETFTTISYDSLGRRTAQTDQAGRTRRFEYDTSGRLKAVILPAVGDPCNGDTLTYPRYEYEYDTYGNMITSRDYVKQFELRSATDFDAATDINDTSARETVFIYNELNKQVARILPDARMETKTYDSNGLLIEAEDFKGQVTEFEYNDSNHPGLLSCQKFYDDGLGDPNIQYEITYDELGRKEQVDINDLDNSTLATYKYYYNQEGQLYQLDSPQGYVRYSFSDITGRRASVFTPEASGSPDVDHDTKLSYGYDELGRLTSVQANKRNGQSPSGETTNYSYNEVGALDMIIYPTGNYVEHTYDNLNHLTKLEHKDYTESSIAKYEYTLSSCCALPEKVVETVAGQQTVIQWYYDDLKRLISEDYNAPGDSNDYDHSYTYNMVGNLLEKEVVGANTTYYYYDANNDELEQIHTADANTYYYYDDNGSLIQEANDVSTVRDYSYNLQNRLSQVDDSTNVVDYSYNPSGKLVQSDVTGGSTLEYLIDPYNHTGYSQVLKTEVDDDVNTVYILGLDVVGQATGTSDPNYFMYDSHGSVRHLANSSGTIATSYNYDAYGNALNFTPSNAATNLLYSGEMYDQYATQYYLRARWYSPETTRFNRMDPFAGNTQNPQSLHKYLYAGANPILYSDPTGKFSIMNVAIGVTLGMLIYTLVGSTLIGPSPSDRCSGSNCKCGPDITFGLKMLSAKLEADFSFWAHPLSDIDYLTGVFNVKSGWGIYGLDNYLTSEADQIRVGNNPSYDCSGTVTISGKCHEGSIANYWLWGRVTSLEGDSLATAASIVTFWKKAMYRGKHLDGALMWTTAGHKELFDVYEATRPDCTPCNENWLTPLKYKWGW